MCLGRIWVWYLVFFSHCYVKHMGFRFSRSFCGHSLWMLFKFSRPFLILLIYLCLMFYPCFVSLSIYHESFCFPSWTQLLSFFLFFSHKKWMIVKEWPPFYLWVEMWNEILNAEIIKSKVNVPKVIWWWLKLFLVRFGVSETEILLTATRV